MGMEFTKAVGSGNDFIVVDNRGNLIPEPSKLAQELCPRRLSVGADGLLLLERPPLSGAFGMRIFNPDGSEAEMCGNGLRCLLLYLVYKGLTPTDEFIPIETKAGLRRGRVFKSSFRNRATVEVSLGIPKDLRLSFSIEVAGVQFIANSVNTGVPHTVIEVTGLSKFPVKELGRKIRFHTCFAPEGTNVNFVELDKDSLRIRTYERGVEDETLSCGTGTAAAGIILNRLGKVDLPVKVSAFSGEVLTVTEERGEAFLSGEARIIYEGKCATTPKIPV